METTRQQDERTTNLGEIEAAVGAVETMVSEGRLADALQGLAHVREAVEALRVNEEVR